MDRQSVFFAAVNPMDDDQNMEEIRCDLDKPRIAPYKSTWRPHQNKVYWCNLKLAQKNGLQFHQTRSHATVLYNTLTACDLYCESGMHEDQGGAIPQSMPIPKVASNCTEAEFAKWTTGLT